VKRLSAVQRTVLAFMLEQAKQGKPTIIVTGHKKTRTGYFPALQAEGVATCTTTFFFLRHHGLIEPVHSGGLVEASTFSDSSQRYTGTDIRYRLTAKAEAALGTAKPSGVVLTPKEWKRRTEAHR
jgi:hypothetical protein